MSAEWFLLSTKCEIGQRFALTRCGLASLRRGSLTTVLIIGPSELDSDAGFCSFQGQIGKWMLFVEGRVKVARLVEIDGRPYVVNDLLIPVEVSPNSSKAKPERPEIRFKLSEEVLERYRRRLLSEQRRKAAKDPETIEKYMGYLRKFYE